MICACRNCGKSISFKQAATGRCPCGQRVRVRPSGDVGYQISFGSRPVKPGKEFKDGDLRDA